MYLPRDEWKLLVGYYYTIGETGLSTSFHEGAIGELYSLRWNCKIREYDDPKPPSSKAVSVKSMRKFMTGMNRATVANRHLRERKLIKMQRHASEPSVVIVSLTVDGYDLGRKYRHWLSRSGLWFAEYNQHWLWFVAATVGGGIVAKLIDRWLDSYSSTVR